MALTQLAPPYPIFTDKNGDPLDNGYLYFGEVNKNPETNPIQVYYDSALTQPAAQPLRTSNGYVMRNGSPSLIYADSQFSVTVRDKNNAMVIYSPVGFGYDPAAISGAVSIQDHTGDGSTVTFGLGANPSTENATNIYIDGVYQQKNTYSTSGTNVTFSEAPPLNSSIEIVSQESPLIGGASASQISYNEGSVGAVNRTVKAKLQEFVSVKDFGAVGDGVTDDTAAIQSAIDACWISGDTLNIPAGTYKISSTIDFFSGQPGGNFNMPFTIVGAGELTKFQYYGTGVAVSFVNNTTQKSAYTGTIIGGFSVENTGGLASTGIHFKGLTRWNMSSAFIASKLFLGKCIIFESNDGKGGLWNQLGYFFVTGDGSNTDWGFYTEPVTNANHILKIFANGDYKQSAIYLQGSRNIVGQIGVDSPSDICKSLVRVTGEYTITQLELEASSSGNTSFVSALQVDDGAKVIVMSPTFVGVSPRYTTAGTSYLFMLPQEDSDIDALNYGYSEIVTNNGLVVDNPLLRSKEFYTEDSTTTIGVSGSYSAYQTVCSLRVATGLRGTKILRSIYYTNNTNVSVDIQIRNINGSSSVGANYKTYTVASGATQEISGHDLSYIIGDYDTDQQIGITARYRTADASFTGQLDWAYAGNDI